MIILWLTELIAKVPYLGLRKILFAIVDNWKFWLTALAGLIVIMWVLSWTSFCGSSGTNKKIEKLEQQTANINENLAIKKNDVNVAEQNAVNLNKNSQKALDNLNAVKGQKVANANRESILKELE
jgi:hypothetical protein